MRILVVDDDNIVLDFLQIFFENMKYEVILVSDPTEAVKKLLTEKPDLVLLDISMPKKNGLEVLKDMREVDKDVSIAMITALKDAEQVIEAFRLGAMDFLLKPFNIDYIVKSVLPRVKVRNR
ncbi:MAG: response regulator [Elusimicrobia bacterium]|nr:response regulator [Candidatus Liberimonas magnetica]